MSKYPNVAQRNKFANDDGLQELNWDEKKIVCVCVKQRMNSRKNTICEPIGIKKTTSNSMILAFLARELHLTRWLDARDHAFTVLIWNHIREKSSVRTFLYSIEFISTNPSEIFILQWILHCHFILNIEFLHTKWTGSWNIFYLFVRF